MRSQTRVFMMGLVFMLTTVLVFAGGRAEEPMQPAQPEAEPVSEDDFDLEALIAAAQEEGEVVVYDTSSRVERVAESFEAEYGIKVHGTKMGNPEQIERLRREVDSGNIQVDVVALSDRPTLVNDLIPRDYAVNYVPPDLADQIPEQFHRPLIYRMGQRVFGYNTDSYDGSPVTNIWQLTEERWHGKVMLRDPTTTPDNLGFFATLTTERYAEILADAYQDLYGEPIELTEENAGWEWVVRFFQNRPVVFRSDDDVGEAVGTAGQTDAPIGLYVYSKHREIEEKNLKLAVAFEMEPFIGYAGGTAVAMVNGAPHPNAARLYIRYLMTEAGVAPWVLDDLGGYSPNPDVGVYPDDELGSWAAWQPYLIPLDPEAAWNRGQDILDLWFTYAQ